MKKRILVFAAILVCMALLGVGTHAYFTDAATVHNVITTDGVNIRILEHQLGEDGKLVPYPTNPVDAMPSKEVSKIVTIENLQADAWIRANVSIRITDAQGKEMELTNDDVAKLITLDFQDSWIAGEDGWYYYNGSVKTGAVTEPLFTEVAFSGSNMTNEYQNCNIQIIVNAQGTQSANNGTTVLEAAGWPMA